MKRRVFILLLGNGIVALPFAAHAQPNIPTIGYFSGRSSESEGLYKEAFHRGLAEFGYREHRNVGIEYRFSEGQDARLPALAADLVHQRVAVLVATDAPSALAAKAATTTIPIVFSTGSDPVKLGVVESLNRPTGNATGIFTFVTDLGPKRLQLLREVVAHGGLVAFIVNMATVNGPAQLDQMKAAAEELNQQVLILRAGTEAELNGAFAAVLEHKADAIVYSASVFFQVMRNQVVSFAAQHSIPAIYEWPEFVTAGGLMSYSSNRSEAGRQLGLYTGQILNGAKPADLPIIQSTKFEFVVNLKTAKALGIKISDNLLSLADRTIE
jgi:putative tryptophan/tyrosine transport system substrate-binding protein